MSTQAFTHVVRAGLAAIVTGTLVAGVGALPAGAQEPTSVKLKVGTQEADQVVTRASWATGVLDETGVEVGRNDEIAVIRNGRAVQSRENRQLRDGDVVKVVRVSFDVRTKTQRFEPKHTKTRETSKLKPGVRKVVHQGRDGVRKVRVRAELRNGEFADRTVLSKRWVRKPHPRVVLVGSRTPTVPGTGHLNWRALAECESGGNPRAVNPAGYYGLYQFSPSTWRSVGGSGMPHHASADQQTYRAQRLYAAQGRSPWPHCGRYL